MRTCAESFADAKVQGDEDNKDEQFFNHYPIMR